MAKQLKTWALNPKQTKANVPKATKEKLTKLANKLVEEKLKLRYVERPRKNQKINYVSDIYTKWVRNFFYFCAQYQSPEHNVRVQTFETKFARLEYLATGKYILSYQRHNGKWFETDRQISQAKALQVISNGGLFMP